MQLEPAGTPDSTRLMAHIGEFAKRVKLSGTAEELESFRYIEAQMRAFGYPSRRRPDGRSKGKRVNEPTNTL